jgi:hypothetical protein
VSTGVGRDRLDPLLSEEDEEWGDWAYGLSLDELDESLLRKVGGGRVPDLRRRGSGFGGCSRRFVLRSSFCRSVLTKLYLAGFLSAVRKCVASSGSASESSNTSSLAVGGGLEGRSARDGAVDSLWGLV